MPSGPIVAGIDFSECGGAALDAATELAVALDVELVLVHAFSPERYVPALMGDAGSELMAEAHAERSQDEAIEFSQIWAERAREGGATVRTIAEDGDPKELLIQYASEEKASMIVVGTHGHKGFKRFVLGSVAEALVRDAGYRVLVVPKRSKK